MVGPFIMPIYRYKYSRHLIWTTELYMKGCINMMNIINKAVKTIGGKQATMEVTIYQARIPNPLGLGRDYGVVYSGSVVARNLEDVFAVFNDYELASKHADINMYKGRSMSVGDIVAVWTNSFTAEYYMVAGSGFEELDAQAFFRNFK